MSRCLLAPLAAVLTAATAQIAPIQHISIQLNVPQSAEPAARRLAEHVNHVISSRSNAFAVVVASANGSRADLELALNASLGQESFSVSSSGDGVHIAGGDTLGLLYGVGRLLHNSSYDGPAPAPFALGSWRGEGAPRSPGSFRAVYFGTHYDNYYASAPLDEVEAYMADLALWGANALVVTVPVWNYTGLSDPRLAPFLNRTAALLMRARRIGLGAGLTLTANQGYSTRPANLSYTPFPDPLHRRNHLSPDSLTCPHKGTDYLLDLRRRLFERLAAAGATLDWIILWPYDEGGCGCEHDWPWGGKGFPRLSAALVDEARRIFPTVKAIASTWDLDKPEAGEYDGLDAFIKADPARSFVFAMVDDPFDGFPRWPLEHGGTIGGLPLVNFPEISMWGRAPWGGWGANPQPTRFEKLWQQTQGAVVGGMPYSEGIFEDVNKVVSLGHFWDGTPADETLRDYIRFEYGRSSFVVDTVVQAVGFLEQTWNQNSGMPAPQRANLSDRALTLLLSVNGTLTPQAANAWRWRLLFLRALIDQTLGANGGKMSGPVLCKAFAEVAAIQHIEDAYAGCAPIRVPCS